MLIYKKLFRKVNKQKTEKKIIEFYGLYFVKNLK